MLYNKIIQYKKKQSSHPSPTLVLDYFLHLSTWVFEIYILKISSAHSQDSFAGKSPEINSLFVEKDRN